MHGTEPLAGNQSRRRTLGLDLVVGLGLFLLYSANGRAIGAGDVVPAMFQAVALVRGDGLVIDRFAPVLRTPDGRLPGYAADERGHAVSRYPVGPAIVAVPFLAPQVWWLDRQRPGWEQDRAAARGHVTRMGKQAAALITALATWLLVSLLRDLGLGRLAWPTALIAALGSGYWPTASQALWQHGPAVLGLTAAWRLLREPNPGPGTLASAGALTALLVACRPIDAVFAAAIGLWVVLHHARPERLAFTLPALAGGSALAAYNVWFFGHLSGGYVDIERMHPWAHGTRGTFTGSLLGGGLGTLCSPSHGLFVYWPWVAVALLGLAARPVRRRLRSDSLGLWLTIALIPNFVLLACYSCWWGGHCYGPRFWIDAVPIFAVLLGYTLEWAWTERRRGVLLVLALAAAWAVALSAVGFLCYPSSWHRSPTNADRDHARLWDWRDNEVTRGLREGVHPPAW